MKDGSLYEHGDSVTSGCRNCTCNDGVMICQKFECPQLTCPESEQKWLADRCCKYCPGD